MSLLETVNNFVWGLPGLLLLLCFGLCVCIKCRFPQIVLFPKACRHLMRQIRGNKESNGVSGYQALCTALAATVGTGNIIGVAGAIIIGGPGAIFWMWVFGFLGMGIKFVEVTLAVRYRCKNENKEYIGGPMYIIRNGLHKRWHWLATVYCIFGVAASFGVGNAAQVNAIISGTEFVFQYFGQKTTSGLYVIIGMILSATVGAVLLGGAKRIGNVAEKLVPVAALSYIFLCLLVLLIRFSRIPHAFQVIIYGAISPRSVTGGALGSVFLAMRIGASRGTFTNEAGMGTASIAHAGANAEPVKQGLLGIMEVFIDTILICTLTGLVILCSGIAVPYGSDAGGTLTMDAFSYVVGTWVKLPFALTVICFAIATIFGWSLYGIRCFQYLFGNGSCKAFAVLQSIVVLVGTMVNMRTAWLFSEIMNALMLIPNLIALFALLPAVRQEIKREGADKIRALV